ncbi:MAG: NADH:flavin oxidoreductase [Pseudohongiella sp.]|nr:NADH:flavin oxidoreductase [Pseudohongiella sp.]MDO9519865.1 NADH:flavin oxidoreductase [Pseudohongiella sp.]MDP2126662.1 NADH:flavin oxidoreductase [Pseudohongiella sp.]
MTIDVLLKPFNSPKLQLKNRVLMAPMTRQFSPDGVPGPDVVDYYRRRAEGDVGLIITEGTTVGHKAASFDSKIPNFHTPEALAGWKKVVEAVHAAGGKIAPQLWHIGCARKPGTGPFPDYPSATPSGLALPGKPVGEPLSVEEIGEIVQAFAVAARNAKEIGFDAVEIHGAHGYLVDDFLWEGLNQRDDKYGGSRAKRSQFAVEIVQAIRAEVGEDFPIIFRFSQWKQQDYNARLATTPEELLEVLKPISDAGVDIFHCSTRRFWEPEFAGSDLNLAGWTKKLLNKPTITVGSVSLSEEFITTFVGGEAASADITELLNRLEKNEFDLVAVGRALIANPDWVKLIQSGKTDALKTYNKSILAELV